MQDSRWRLLTIYPSGEAAGSVRGDVETQRGKNTTTHARVLGAVDKLASIHSVQLPRFEHPAHGPSASVLGMMKRCRKCMPPLLLSISHAEWRTDLVFLSR